MSHANAALTPRARLRLAQLVVDDGWTYSTAARMFMVAPRTARKWADRYRTEGSAGMADRSCRPRRSPTKTPANVVRQIVRLRWRHRLGPVQIAGHLGVSVLSDNGACYRSFTWRDTCAELGITHKRTRPYRPQTNGKIERFHRTLADGWAYARRYDSDTARRQALPGWLHSYNHHRAHSAIGGSPPISRLTNLPGHHN